MEKQLNPSVKAHLPRGPFYLILLVPVCVTPFALVGRGCLHSLPRLQPLPLRHQPQLRQLPLRLHRRPLGDG